MIEFKLPELGENVTSGDVLRVLVKPGETIAKEQPVLELETDKATIEVPSAVAGQVKDVKVKPGEKVTVGQVILTVDQAAATQDRPNGAAASETPVTESSPKPSAAPAQNTEPATGAHPVDAAPDRAGKVVDISRGARQTAETTPSAPAAPSVRRMARELGVDIDQVGGTGLDGRVSIEDVKAHARRLVTGAKQGSGTGTPVFSEPLPDFTRWGTIDRQPLRAVRRKTAEHLTVAWTAIPHVTQHALADVTALEEQRKRYAGHAETAGGNLTVTAIAVKVVATALNVFPQFNSSIDLAASEIIYKKFVNIGVAVDTDRGLLVPVVRNADTKGIIEISVELTQLSEKARNRRITLDEMQGGCFSVSNLGGIGGDYFTPIVNIPEVAILGISRARYEPVYDKSSGQFQPRLMLPLSLSYDHRVIDGADGARFLKWVVEAFEQPFVLALHG